MAPHFGHNEEVSSLADRVARLKSDLDRLDSVGDSSPLSSSNLALPVGSLPIGGGNGLPIPTLPIDPAAPVTSVVGGSNISIPWENILPLNSLSLLNAPADVRPYCNIAAAQPLSMVKVFPDTGSDDIKLNSFTLLPIGDRIDLTALLPGTSGLLYGSGSSATSPALAALPPETTITVAWQIESVGFTSFTTSDINTNTTRDANLGDLKDFFQPAVKGYGIGLGETSSSYQLLSNNLFSPILSFVPWPETATSADTVTVPDRYRAFRISLQITCWWPGSATPTPFLLPLRAYFITDRWSSIIPDTSKLANYIPSNGAFPSSKPAGTITNPLNNVLQSLNNMFTATLDSAAPALGKAATLAVVPTDKQASLPGQVKQLITSSPDIKIQAALDLSAVLTGFIKQAASLFSGTPAAPTITAAEVGVDKVLSSLLSIPVALDINGSSLAKTVEPLVGLPLPNMSTLQSGLGTSGLVPISNLTASLSTVVDSLILTIPDGSAIKSTVKGLTASLLPIPQFKDLLNVVRGGDGEEPKPIDIQIAIKAQLVLPGASKGIDIYFDLGTISLSVPMIPIPQVVVMARSSMITNASGIADLLISVDPETLQYLPNVALILNSLQIVDQALAVVLGLFTSGVLGLDDLDSGGLLPWSSIANLTAALNVVVPLISKVGVAITLAPFTFGYMPDWTPANNKKHGPPPNMGYSTTIDLNTDLAPKWFTFNTDSATNTGTNIVSLAWIGATRTTSSPGWRMTGSLDSWKNTDILVLPSLRGTQVCAATLDVAVPSSDAIWESTPDKTQSKPVDGWNGHISQLNWIYDMGIPQLTLQPKKVVRFRYFKLHNSTALIIKRCIWSDKDYKTRVWINEGDYINVGEDRWTDLATETDGKILDDTQYWFGADVRSWNGQALLDDPQTDYITDFSSQLMVTFKFDRSGGSTSVTDDGHSIKT